MEITTKYCCNLPTKKSKKHFKIGSWYKSNKQNITALYSGNPERNDGFWGMYFIQDFFRMVTPDEWQMVQEPIELIKKSNENKL